MTATPEKTSDSSPRIILEPSVYLVGTQTINRAELDRFMADNEYPEWSTYTEVACEELAEVAGRVCYRSFFVKRPGGNKAYIDHVLEVAHNSVIEHAAYNFLLTGISRSLSHELVRHRIASFSQLSQRYVDESDCAFVVPPDLRLEVESALYMEAVSGRWDGDVLVPGMSEAEGNSRWPAVAALAAKDIQAYYDATDVGEDWLQTVGNAHAGYCRLVDHLVGKAKASRPDLSNTDARKYARQAARSVLPNATETQIFVTMNARSLRHFLKMRVSRFADAEIRRAAYQMYLLVRDHSAHIFGDFTETVLEDGSVEISTPNHEA